MEKLKFNALKFGTNESLTRKQMKNVMGGLNCLALGASCTGNVQCCSNVCTRDGGGSTGAHCTSTAIAS